MKRELVALTSELLVGCLCCIISLLLPSSPSPLCFLFVKPHRRSKSELPLLCMAYSRKVTLLYKIEWRAGAYAQYSQPTDRNGLSASLI